MKAFKNFMDALDYEASYSDRNKPVTWERLAEIAREAIESEYGRIGAKKRRVKKGDHYEN